MKRLAVILAVVALAAAGCGEAIDWPSTTAATTTSDPTTSTSVTTTAATTSTTQAETTSSIPGGEAGDVGVEIQALIGTTEELRGRRFIEPVEVTLVSAEEMAARVRTNLQEELDPEEIAVEQAFARLLGILPVEVDLAGAIEDLYAEQVVGFYDGDTGELVVAGEELTPLGRTIVIHELIHALTDQHFGMSASLDDLVEAERYHEAAALQALAEGDATYFQMVYLQQMAPDDQVAALLESLQADTSVLDSLPDWVGEDLGFPYESGFGFVERLVEEGGSAAVDQAYLNPPFTVEQILHPNAYFTLEPARPVALPATALEGYEVVEEGAFGEWNLMLYLLEGVGDGEAAIAAGGWGGDVYRLHWNGSEVAFAYLFEGDAPRDAEELAAALAGSLRSNMAVSAPVTDAAAGSVLLEGSDFAFVQRVGRQVLAVIAGDPVVGRALVDALRLPPED
ncbi:MAG: hypothetical protein JW785_04310 [Acidimicrobiia bacterium]|nr:hypothetical protein [Acidimicrobiia bacterium]